MQVIPQVQATYLAMIKNSVGSSQFQNCYALVDGEPRDITDGGDLSCAFYVSSLCLIFSLVKAIHATVGSTITDLLDSGWSKVSLEEAQPGDIIVWGTSASSDSHKHIGFYLGNNQAVSNSSISKVIAQHHWQFQGHPAELVRNIELILHYNFPT